MTTATTSVYKKWRLYCDTDQRVEYVWQQTEPTTCPTNAEHQLAEYSVSEAAQCRKTKKLFPSNSPYYMIGHNFYVCRTANDPVTVVLPSANGLNDGRRIYVVREGPHSVYIYPYTNETINGSSSLLTLTADKEFAKFRSDGNSNWVRIDMRDEDDAPADEDIDGRTSTLSDTWKYVYLADSGVNGGTNVANAWTRRELNTTERTNGNEALRNCSKFSLDQGSYVLRATAIFYKTGVTRMRLRNLTDNTTHSISHSYSADIECPVQVLLDARIDIVGSASKTYCLEYYCTLVQEDSGLGLAAATGDAENYFTVFIQTLV